MRGVGKAAIAVGAFLAVVASSYGIWGRAQAQYCKAPCTIPLGSGEIVGFYSHERPSKVYVENEDGKKSLVTVVGCDKEPARGRFLFVELYIDAKEQMHHQGRCTADPPKIAK